MAEYLYRGNETGAFVEELEDGTIYGQHHDIHRGELASVPDDARGRRLDSLDWVSIERDSVPVTGGVTDALAQTKRFSGGENYAMVLDASALPFEEIQYDYDWFNDHPGAYDHVLANAAGEIRLTGPGRPPQGQLYGAAEKEARLNEPDYLQVREWGTRTQLPAMSSRSRFADEAEWVAFQESVSIGHAIEGVVAFKRPLGVRVLYSEGRDLIPKDVDDFEDVLPEVYEQLREPLPPWTTFYLLVADVNDRAPFGGWYADDIEAVYRDDGRVDPENIPPRFRGVN